MALRYGDVVDLLLAVHGLPAGRRSSVEARIKNFQKLGFPTMERGRAGEHADYGPRQLIELLVAFELLRFRMPPGAVSEIIAQGWADISAAFGRAAASLIAARAGAPVVGERPLLSIDSMALHEVGKTVVSGKLQSRVEVEGRRELAATIAEPGSKPFRSGLIVDPASVLDDLLAELPGLRRDVDAGELLERVARWGGS